MSGAQIRTKQFHEKTRTGCKTCRKRRVKCDESNFPSCQNCIDRGIYCSWLADDARGLQTQDLVPWNEEPTIEPIINVDGLSDYDLELLHHFTTSTATSLFDVHSFESPNILGIYQRNAPRLALKHPFLMHALLALSALHLHRLNQTSQASTVGHYYALSCYHRTHAVQTYNHWQCLSALCSPLCSCGGLSDAQFLSNLILSLHALCDTMLGILDRHIEARVVHWFVKGKGRLDTLYSKGDGKALIGPRSPAASQGQGPSVYFPSVPRTFLGISSAISLSPLLYSLHNPFSGAPDDAELLWPDPPNTAQVYADWVHAVHVCYRLFFEKCAPLRVLMIWMTIMAPPENVRFLVERRPRAHIIWAHIVNLHQWCHLEEAAWWEIYPPWSVNYIREQLPGEEWKAYLDASLASIEIPGNEQRFESISS
ncbi:hypothetical protein DL96DRAFT_1819270 [Flagelloscypha sp. PMI_526]|nr:hypothetical protein DL96DRAFT_1819270 [Flagelloscypha sp. PMI_526]